MPERDPYSRAQVVRAYERETDLQKPEEILLARLAAKLKDMRMLDIGVGAGRTTAHFAPLTREYVAIDYSPQMVERCNQRFPELARRNAFQIGDARSMTAYSDNRFDFVLFSFNGIDSVSLGDRQRIFKEMQRVCEPGGYVLFSSHNLNADPEEGFRERLWSNPRILVVQLYRHLLFRLVNRKLRETSRTAPFMIINDGAHGFPTRHFYIRAQEQVRHLEEMGFVDIEVLSLNGTRLEGEAALAQTEDPWLYYLCRVSKP